MKRVKILRATTIPLSLDVLLVGQLKFLNQFFEVIAVASDGAGLEKVSRREGVKTFAVSMERDISLIRDIRSLFNWIKLIKREKPLIIHANTPKASLLCMVGGWVCGIPCRIYTVTGLRFEGEKSFKKRGLIWMERVTCFFATKIIPEGNGVKRKMEYYNLTSKPLKVLANGNINGVDLDLFSDKHFDFSYLDDTRKTLGIEPDDMVFVFVGRLVRDKGIGELIEAFKLLNKERPNTKLLLLGSMEPQLDALNRETLNEIHGNKSIKALGFQEDIRRYLAISHVLVLPSYREGFPNVVLQGGAMNLPAIVSDITGCNEIIIHGENGLIIPRKNIAELHKAMVQLHDDKSLYKKLKANSRLFIAQRYEQKIVWNALLDEYKKLIQTNGK